MNRLRRRARRDERGAALIFAIAFMVIVGGFSAATLSSVTSGIKVHSALAPLRNGEYAADGAIERSIVRVRNTSSPGSNPNECGTSDVYSQPSGSGFYGQINGVSIRVDCVNTPSVSGSPTGPVSQNNVSFAACLNTAVPCVPGTSGDIPIITAHINFQVTGPQVSTFVQAWSVNG